MAAPGQRRGARLGLGLGLGLALVAGTPGVARACDVCVSSGTTAADNASLAVVGGDAPDAGRVRVLGETRAGIHGANDGSGGRVDVFEARWSGGASWTPTPWLTAVGMMPLVYRHEWMGTYDGASGFGPGDAEVMLRAHVLRDRPVDSRHVLSVLAGLKLPTAPELRAANGRPLPMDVQPGTGSWDPYAGLSYVYYGARASMYVSATLLWPTAGRLGYTEGQSVAATVAPQLRVTNGAALMMALDARWYAPDRQLGDNVPDSAGFILCASPTLLATAGRNLLFRATLQIPIVQTGGGMRRESPAAILGLIYSL